jgi:signal transduction histidine kinase
MNPRRNFLSFFLLRRAVPTNSAHSRVPSTGANADSDAQARGIGEILRQRLQGSVRWLVGVLLLLVGLVVGVFSLGPLPAAWRFALLLAVLLLAGVTSFTAVLVLRSWRELNAAQQLLGLATGNLVQAYASLKDANQSLRETAQARDDALQRLQTATRERDAFLAAIAHDLRTPLTVIKGNAQLLAGQFNEQATVDQARIAKRLDQITSNTDRLTALVNRLLWLAQLEMDQSIVLERTPTDLVALTRRIVLEYEETTTLHQLGLTTSSPKVEGCWDPELLQSVVANLVSNAIKYSPNGGAIEVKIEVDDSRQMAMLSVSDHGLGIPAIDLPHIFDRFYRAANVGDRIFGTGMGLAGVRHAVEAHGGQVAVDSLEGVGSTFIVELPLDCKEPAQIAPEP